jgi:hypothetical protein
MKSLDVSFDSEASVEFQPSQGAIQPQKLCGHRARRAAV